ncbi:hypothetical protein HPP92_016289 [Vanilla planifolia]|uniref:Polypyrimidine tract-binding protein n=1 Tax=Vanilla planifolia TaxID=51239 RepID=A0A835URY4_VANPL|nr:hypothetical protein HPP92_016289 [Vanilla planifolia]
MLHPQSQLRFVGKTVYIQYSNRQEIVNNKSSGDIAGNVLLVTIEGVEAGDVSIDVIHLVFSAFGFVHKIATFEKAAGFQALIQFTDAETAAAARSELDGRSIPRYLLPDHVTSCHLRISYSAHTDLNIKFQSHRDRDYTNPFLPVNPSAIEGTIQPIVGPDGKKKEQESNVLLACIENMQYAVTVDVLHTVFSAFGAVQKIAIFEKNGGMQALIQYPDVTTAAVAKEALEDTASMMVATAHSDKSRDYTIPDAGVLSLPQAPPGPAAVSSWQTASQAASIYGTQALTDAQKITWDSNMHGLPPGYPPAPGTYAGQTYVAAAAASVSSYSAAGAVSASSVQMPQSSQMPPYGVQAGANPQAFPPSVGRPPLYY